MKRLHSCLPITLLILALLEASPGPAFSAGPPAPTVWIQSPADNFATNAQTLEVVVGFQAYVDPVTGLPANVQDIDLLLNGVRIQTKTNPANVKGGTMTFAVNLSGMTDQVLELSARGYQGARIAGLVGSSARCRVVLDRTPPVVSFVKPTEGFIALNQPRPEAVVAFTDNLSGFAPSGVHLTLDTTDVSATLQVGNGSATYLPGADLPPGPRTYAVHVTDRAGNSSGVARVTFEVLLAEAAGWFGPEGGSLEVLDPNSVGNGVSVAFPEGALTAPALVTINCRHDVPALISVQFVGPTCDISLRGSPGLLQPATVRFPYSAGAYTQVQEEELTVFHHPRSGGEWEPLDSWVNRADLRVSAQTTEFSAFGIGIWWKCDVAMEKGNADICDGVKLLNDDLTRLENEAKASTTRAIGKDAYDTLHDKYYETVAAAKAELGYSHTADDAIVKEMQAYVEARNAALAHFNTFTNSAVTESYNQAYANLQTALAAMDKIDLLLKVVSGPAGPDWIRLLTPGGVGRVIKDWIGRTFMLFEAGGAGAGASADEILYSFYKTQYVANQRQDVFTGIPILNTTTDADGNAIITDTVVPVGTIPAAIWQQYESQKVLQVVQPLDNLEFGFLLFRPETQNTLWRRCTDWGQGQCPSSVQLPVSTEALTTDSSGTYAFIYSFKGSDSSYVEAGISLTAKDRLITYTNVRDPFVLGPGVRGWGSLIIPRNALLDLPEGTLTVTFRFYKSKDDPSPVVFEKRLRLTEGAFTLSGDIGSNLVAHWPLDGSGEDVSGNGHDGTVYGGVLSAADRDGDPGHALSFDGTSGYISVGQLHPPTTGFAVSFWMKPAKYVTTSGYQLENEIIGDAGGYRGFRFYQGGSRFLFQYQNTSYTYKTASITLTSADTTKWTHVVGVYSAGGVYLYRDGSLVASDVGGGPITGGYRNLEMGRDPNVQTSYWQGLLDDVRIYGRALTAEDVKALYAAR